ncbi:hypothetical protein B0H11DRAFT_1993478, partial [Mycena galericulata]
MNPLSRTDLPLVENWMTFQPNMTGYIAPQQLTLHPDCSDSQIREFVEDQFDEALLRDAFCLWRHTLNGATGMANPSTTMLYLLTQPFKSVRNLMGNDAIVLCRLAPLAKAYGFKMHISELEHILSVRREVYHDYKDSGYLDDDDYYSDDDDYDTEKSIRRANTQTLEKSQSSSSHL